MKKMGRPSRKMIASIITFEEPDGDTLFFSIDKKGRSKLLGNKENLFAKNNNQNISPILQKTNEQISENTEQKQKSQIKDNSNNKHFKIQFQDDKFKMFLEKIEKKLNLEDFYKDFRLSNNMIIPIIA